MLYVVNSLDVDTRHILLLGRHRQYAYIGACLHYVGMPLPALCRCATTCTMSVFHCLHYVGVPLLAFYYNASVKKQSYASVLLEMDPTVCPTTNSATTTTTTITTCTKSVCHGLHAVGIPLPAFCRYSNTCSMSVCHFLPNVGLPLPALCRHQCGAEMRSRRYQNIIRPICQAYLELNNVASEIAYDIRTPDTEIKLKSYLLYGK